MEHTKQLPKGVAIIDLKGNEIAAPSPLSADDIAKLLDNAKGRAFMRRIIADYKKECRESSKKDVTA